MNRKITSLLLVVAVVMLVILGAGCEKLRARDQLNKGVQAFRNGSYPTAVENFKVAVSLDPQFPDGPTLPGHVLHDAVHPRGRVSREHAHGASRA